MATPQSTTLTPEEQQERRRARERAKSKWYRARHPEQVRAQNRRNYLLHKEQRAQYRQRYYQAHKEQARESARRSYAKYRDDPEWLLRRRARHLANYYRNREKTLARRRVSALTKSQHAKERARWARMRLAHADKRKRSAIVWAQANPERRRAIEKQRRVRKRAALRNDFSRAQWQEMQSAYGYRCVYCHERKQRLTQDHLTPLSQGGSHTLMNIVPACRKCNSRKRTAGPLAPVQPLLLTIAPTKGRRL